MRQFIYILFFILIGLNINLYAQKQEEKQAGEQEEIQEEETKDPFLSIDDKVKLLQKPVDITKLPYPIILNGIIWSDNLQVAILNNETVEKNQQWRDFRVEAIEKEKVILKLGDNSFEIPLAEEEGSENK